MNGLFLMMLLFDITLEDISTGKDSYPHYPEYYMDISNEYWNEIVPVVILL